MYKFLGISLLFLSKECDSLSIERSKKEEKINSPICVSPHRDKLSRNREDDETPFDGKLSVKERLYVSRHTIGLYCIYCLICCYGVLFRRKA